MKRPSVEKLVLARMEERGRGGVFTPKDFSDLGGRSAVAVALHRLVKKEVVRNIGNGLYCMPTPDPYLGEITASVDDIVQAIAKRDGIKLRLTGARAANLIGITTQVAARTAYLTDGRARMIRIPRSRPDQIDHMIPLRHTSARYMNARTEIGYLVIQGCRNHGRKHFGKKEYAAISRRLPPDAKRELLQDLDTAPAWIADIMRRLAAEAQ
ncbi:MAG: DUF6088 family protein [Flavobacteriales bacterium]|jgi:hypothetical protein